MTQYRPWIRWYFLTFALLALFVAGCHKKAAQAPPPAPAPPPPPAQPTATLSADRTNIDKGESAKLSWSTTNATNVSIAPEVGAVTPQGSTSVSPARSTTYTLSASGEGGNATATVSISVNQPAPPAPTPKPSFNDLFTQEVHDAFFDLDKADIRADAQQVLQQDAAFLKQYPEARVTIEGYCDERGSTEYNLALGQRRANAVKEYLVSLGIPAANLSTTSYGKEKQFCTEHNETCWQENRRGHLVPSGQ
jgi:peptidoglycan-associated lipoprotein